MNPVYSFSRLQSFAELNHIRLGETELKQFEQLCSLLIEKNKVMNLTAIVEPEQIEQKHFIDSLSSVSLITNLWSEMLFERMGEILPEDAGFKLIDVGCGAGFPGLPLKIAFPKAEFLLMDSLAKRISFVNETIETLGLTQIEAVSARAEDLAKVGSVSRETFDFCVSRAVADAAVLTEYCLPFVKVNGYCILYKSGQVEEELNNAETAVSVLGGKVVDVIRSTLFESDAERSLVVIRKMKPTPDKYPRRPGKPSKSPIK